MARRLGAEEAPGAAPPAKKRARGGLLTEAQRLELFGRTDALPDARAPEPEAEAAAAAPTVEPPAPPLERAPAMERDKQRQKAAVANYAVERDKQLKAKDLEIAKLREQVLAAKNGQAVDTDTKDKTDTDQKRLNEISQTLRALGNLTGPAVVAARESLEAERTAIKSKIVSSKPHSAQVHHYTTRIDELLKSRLQQEETLADLEIQKVEPEAKVEGAKKFIHTLATGTTDLEHQRFAVSAQLSTPLPESYSLKTMVPALDLPVDKLGQLFVLAGADATLLDQAKSTFEDAVHTEFVASDVCQYEVYHGLAPAAAIGALAAHVRWGIKHGITMISIYLRDGQGLSDANVEIIWQVAIYIWELEAREQPWLLAGDWNRQVDDLRHWFNSIGGIAIHPKCPTCLQAKPGTMYDYTCMHPRVDCRAGKACVHEDSGLFPHVPVRAPLQDAEHEMRARVPDQPASVDTMPKPGCAWFPPAVEWDMARGLIAIAEDADALADAWDAVLTQIEEELLDRHDVMGHDRARCLVRAGPATWSRKKVAPPEHKPSQRLQAYKLIGRWFRHMRAMKLRMILAVERLQTDVDVPGKIPRHMLPTNHTTDTYSSWARSLSTFGAYDAGLSMTDDAFADDKELKLFVKLA
ncbi:unnamed protein product [Prorocentrum cordatum]|uniref:Uncharacterized protein n=1 Tax=Prorocentrum cordatum TaxID=2364126 RepID=A0ABN9X996_9DINO|nr:unnamed protein product [Polarella glacialis]